MRQKIVGVTGISGVGKTTFIRKLAEQTPLQHLTGGSLIARARAGTALPRDVLRQFDLDENQRLLVEGFMAARDPSAEIVLFDGHVVIDTPDGLAEIPTSVFKALGICLMVHLEADPIAIKHNRQHDPSRVRPVLEVDSLRDHQDKSRRHATAIASALDVECLILHAEDVPTLTALLSVQ